MKQGWEIKNLGRSVNHKVEEHQIQLSKNLGMVIIYGITPKDMGKLDGIYD